MILRYLTIGISNGIIIGISLVAAVVAAMMIYAAILSVIKFVEEIMPSHQDRVRRNYGESLDLLRRIQDALVENFYDPDPADPELDYSKVDWVGVIRDTRAALDKCKSKL